MIPDETIEQVRDSTDLVGLIGESVALKRTGSDYRGPCPFHGGTNRNFPVIPKKGRYYCFVCHESGDVFSWFMKRMGMDYPDGGPGGGAAGGHRHSRAAPTGPDPIRTSRCTARWRSAHDWFARQLLELPDAKRRPRVSRGPRRPLDTAALLGAGLRASRKAFLEAMAELGVEHAVLLEAGLAAAARRRSVIPGSAGGCSSRSTIFGAGSVGFGGRLLGPGEPKYLNSPETEIFHKGKQLYNLHQAERRRSERKKR